MDVPTHFVVHEGTRGRIVCMDSMGYVDSRIDVSDVIVCGSHSATCATQLAARARPRGVIGHDAGIGLRRGGITGLKFLARFRIPGAAVSCHSARINDGKDMYERGSISAVNSWAAQMGIRVDMAAREAARRMLEEPFPMPTLRALQKILYQGKEGLVIGLDTIKYADARLTGAVIVMGSHAASTMAKYVLDLPIRIGGAITNDAGLCADDSAIGGLPILDERGLPCAVVSVETAEVGNAVSTFEEGIISHCNITAAGLGVRPGMTGREAAMRMLPGRQQLNGEVN